MSAAAPLLTPPTKCYCKFEKQHFLILADVFEDMSKNCSDPQFSDTLQRSSEVFANMATNCSESRAPAPQAPQAQAQASKLTQYSKALAEASVKKTEARAAQAQTGSVVVPTSAVAPTTASIDSSASKSEDIQLILDQSIAQREQRRKEIAASEAIAKSIGAKYQDANAVKAAAADAKAAADASAEAEAKAAAEARAAAEAKAAADAKAAPQVPAIQDLTRIRLNDRQKVSYKMITDTLNSMLAQYNEGTDDYKILTQILNEVKAAQTVSEVEKVLTNYKLTTIFQNKSGNYFSIDPKAAMAQARAEAEAEAPAPVQAPAPQVQVPVQAAPFKQPKSDEKFKTRGSNVGFNYARIIREIDEVLNSKMNSPEMEVMKAKYILLKPRLENAQTYADVQKILNDEDVKWSSNKITSGGTRKRRLKKTLRKRSKKTKKAGKRK